MAEQVRKRLLEILKKIDRPGTFCTSGRLPTSLSGLEVAGLGPISFPLQKRQATALKKIARQAPFGKGTRTLVDTDVRRVWEIDAEQVSLSNPEWPNTVNLAVEAAQSALGLEKQTLQAHLYKVLLYEPGSFFLSHRDGEKLDRMVATLVIALPSAHTGGALVVRHEGREETVDFGPESPFQTQFAAFYADCEHEIRPVDTGFRLALVYNLALAKSKQPIQAPTSGEHIEAVAQLLQKWKGEYGNNEDGGVTDEDHAITKLAVVLDHEYTQSGLKYDALKGIDRAQADVLFAAARQSGCDAYLALVTKWESGSAEPTGDYGYGYSRSRGRYEDDEDDEGEHQMGEVFDESLTAEHFSDAQGHPLAFEQLPLNDDEIVSETPLNEGLPDKEDFEGYTGNAGMTLEHWYHHAAVILWPTESRFDVLCEAGVEAAVGGLAQMIERWKHARKSEQAALKQHCLDFAHRIIAHWPKRDYASTRSPHSLISLLEELADASLISAWLRGVLAKDVSVDPGKSLEGLCQQHGWTTFQDELRELFEATSSETLERQTRLLADWSQRKDKDVGRITLCAELARNLMSAVERWDPRQVKRDWSARTVNHLELLPPLAQTFLVLDEPALLERLVAYVLERSMVFDLTTVQVPALLTLEKWLTQNVKRSSPALNHWLSAAASELETRASQPPEKPADWRREPATGCSCADCKQLSRFLEDPEVQMLRFSGSQSRRRHLEHVINGKGLDTTHVTDERSRPQTLVCTKTTASHERALKAHQVGLANLEKIRRLLAWHAGLPSRSERRKSNSPKATKKSRK